MFDRDITDYIKYSAKYYPVVTVTGPRQSGKTTLVKMIFSDKPYVSLEDVDIREFAQKDPIGFYRPIAKEQSLTKYNIVLTYFHIYKQK